MSAGGLVKPEAVSHWPSFILPTAFFQNFFPILCRPARYCSMQLLAMVTSDLRHTNQGPRSTSQTVGEQVEASADNYN